MNAAARTRAAMPRIPAPRAPAGTSIQGTVRSTPAVAYQRVVHRMFRREFRLLGDLALWASADDTDHAAEIVRHADLMSRVLLQHHAIERDLLWPALFRSLPASQHDATRAIMTDWTTRAAALDSTARDLGTAARQWTVAGTSRARDAFVSVCGRVADAVDVHTAAEEADLLPLLGAYLADGDWAAIRRSARNPFTGSEQMLVLGLALEDACALDRARLLAGLHSSARTAWHVVGHRNFHAAVVRLRGAPPSL